MFSFHDYKDLVESGSYNDAFSIIKSLVHKKINNINNLYEYVFVFQNLIETTSLDDIKEQINDFKKCVENYKTNVRLDKIKLSKLKEIDKKIFEYQTIYKNKSERLISEKEDSVKRQNTEILETLSTILTQLDDIQTEDDFNKLLLEVRRNEKELDVSSLSDEERLSYDNLIDQYANKIQELTDRFNQISLKEYNMKAIDDLHEVFNEFVHHKRKFLRNIRIYQEFIIEKMLSIDVNKLFKEANDYYNYVYSYIFNRLKGEDKYYISKLVLEVKKRWLT